MRMSYEKICWVTGLKRKSSQKKWFKNHFGVDVPKDKIGIILSDAAYEKLLEKQLGLLSFSSEAKPKPRINLRKK